MNYGYNGRILRVNLSNNSLSTEEADANLYRKYVGGWGFIGYYLLKELTPIIDPKEKANLIDEYQERTRRLSSLSG